jgi:hypothetical protein
LILKSTLSPEEVLTRLRELTSGPERLFSKGGPSDVYSAFSGNTFQLVSSAGRRSTGYRRKFYGKVEPLNSGSLISGAFRMHPAVRGLLLTLLAIFWLIGLAIGVQTRSLEPLAIPVLFTVMGWTSIALQLAWSADGERVVRSLLRRAVEGEAAWGPSSPADQIRP